MEEQFGDLVRHHREQLGLSQQDLGDLVDRTAVTIGRIERGESSPLFESLSVFAAALKVEVRDLFGLGEYAAKEGREDPLVRLISRLSPLGPDELEFVDEIVAAALKLRRSA
ncbi:helix-turn-helix transcriptional regulator [Caulobacter sp.]|uniref:helix-turn-helix transcriptional regulator n=1 Tax=Caulobacter sp. TaxID=78 RepID=UPI0031D98FB5